MACATQVRLEPMIRCMVWWMSQSVCMRPASHAAAQRLHGQTVLRSAARVSCCPACFPLPPRFARQDAWIQNTTLRKNVLMGGEYDEDAYTATLQVGKEEGKKQSTKGSLTSPEKGAWVGGLGLLAGKLGWARMDHADFRERAERRAGRGMQVRQCAAERSALNPLSGVRSGHGPGSAASR